MVLLKTNNIEVEFEEEPVVEGGATQSLEESEDAASLVENDNVKKKSVKRKRQPVVKREKMDVPRRFSQRIWERPGVW